MLLRHTRTVRAALLAALTAVSLTGVTVVGTVGATSAIRAGGPVTGISEGVGRQALPRSLVALVNSSAPADDVFSAQFCGGVLIGAREVATVAHCLTDRDPASVDVIVGADNLCQGQQVTGQRLPVESLTSAPSGHNSDVVVLRLAAPATVAPARVAGPAGRSQHVGTAAGWGRAALLGAHPCQGRSVPLHAGTAAACAAALRVAHGSQPTQDVWCAVAAGDRNTCIGDSGGPVYVPGAFPETVFALTSWGVGDCGPDAPGVYTVLSGTGAAPWGSPPRRHGLPVAIMAPP